MQRRFADILLSLLFYCHLLCSMCGLL